jgi:cytochrome c-type protein NapC
MNNKIWDSLKRPTSKFSLGALLIVGFGSGIIFWGGFNTAMELTNNEEFCISCHEMKDNVYEEYKETIHYNNRTGVRATCPDCHVPKEWHYKVIRKIQASNELLHKALGSIDTREKFEAKRLQLAQHVWDTMKKTDSRECRNCHDYDSMDFVEQGRRAVKQHSEGLDSGKTCIDCHQGIAHQLPDMREVDSSAVIGIN